MESTGMETLRKEMENLRAEVFALTTGAGYLTSNLKKAEDHFDKELDRAQRQFDQVVADLRKDFDRAEAELEDTRKELRAQKSDYDKLVAKGVGVSGAVMFIGALLGWIINTARGH